MGAVFFDLDGTLHDRATSLRWFASDRASRLGLAGSDKERFVHRFLELDANGKVWKDQVYSRLCDDFDSSGWPSTETLVTDYVQTYAHFAVETPGATQLLSMLGVHGVKLGILTNGRGDLQRSVIQALGFGSMLNSIIVSEEVGCRKPQREIFQMALASVASDPSEAIMVGDDPVADIEGALGAGVYPIAFRCVPSAPVVVANDMECVGNEIFKRLRGVA